MACLIGHRRYTMIAIIVILSAKPPRLLLCAVYTVQYNIIIYKGDRCVYSDAMHNSYSSL